MQLTRRAAVTIGAGSLLVGLAVGAATRSDGDGERVASADTTSTVPTTSSSLPPSSVDVPTTGESSTTTSTTRPPARSSTTTTAPGPPFEASVSAVTALDLGTSWRPGCPVPPEQLRAIDLTFWDYDDAVQQGRLIVHVDQADRVVAAMRAVYEARFPIQRMRPVDAYGSDDQASMRDNNTSAFNCRNVAGTSTWSQHAYGRAVDINPLVNPYVKGGTVDPPEGAPYADRSRRDKGMIHANDAVVRAFAAQGWGWGGYWSGGKDYQHFSRSGS